MRSSKPGRRRGSAHCWVESIPSLICWGWAGQDSLAAPQGHPHNPLLSSWPAKKSLLSAGWCQEIIWRRRQTAPAPQKHIIESERDPEGMPGDQSVADLHRLCRPLRHRWPICAADPTSLGRRVELSSSPLTQEETKAHCIRWVQ